MDRQLTIYQKTSLHQSAGFTLIELMITVVIIGILVGIAVPSYQAHVKKTRRATATVCLMDYAQLMERSYSANFSFDFDVDGDNSKEQELETMNRSCATDLASYYNFSFDSLAGSTYMLKATPTASQGDAACGSLKLDQAGTRSVTGTSSAADCW